MNIGLLLTAILLAGAQSLPTSNAPLRNTFVVAAETVIDDASKIDLKAADAVSDAQVQQLRAAQSTLTGMAQDDREKEIAGSANDLVFAVTACHLQATNGANTDTCRAQFGRARARVMEAIHKHKAGDAWVEGPPA